MLRIEGDRFLWILSEFSTTDSSAHSLITWVFYLICIIYSLLLTSLRVHHFVRFIHLRIVICMIVIHCDNNHLRFSPFISPSILLTPSFLPGHALLLSGFYLSGPYAGSCCYCVFMIATSWKQHSAGLLPNCQLVQSSHLLFFHVPLPLEGVL